MMNMRNMILGGLLIVLGAIVAFVFPGVIDSDLMDWTVVGLIVMAGGAMLTILLMLSEQRKSKRDAAATTTSEPVEE